MEFLYPNATPAYKGTSQQSQAATSTSPGVVSYLLGGNQASYKTINGASASAPASARSWWQVWGTAPVYKTAPAADPSDSVTTDNGDTDMTDDDCDDAQGMTTQVVIL